MPLKDIPSIDKYGAIVLLLKRGHFDQIRSLRTSLKSGDELKRLNDFISSLKVQYSHLFLDKPLNNPILIAHAGGQYDGIKYSNSLDSFELSLKYLDFIELDFCKSQDGVIVAHDGLEAEYGLTKKFNNITTEEFLKSRFRSRLSPMSLSKLCELLVDSKSRVVLDIKSQTNQEYSQILSVIESKASAYGVIDKLVPKVYSLWDIDIINNSSFSSSMLALWKIFNKNCQDEVQQCVAHYCSSTRSHSSRGLSMPAKYILNSYLNTCKYLSLESHEIPIFLHDFEASKAQKFLNKGFNLYAHDALQLIKYWHI